MNIMKRLTALALALGILCLTLAGCGGGSSTQSSASTLVYGSGDYTRINPAMDEHCEINALLFDGLTDHDGDGSVIPRLAESWDWNAALPTVWGGDVVAEGFQHRSLPVWGVQWHPEFLFSTDVDSRRLFGAFTAALGTNAGREQFRPAFCLYL